MKGSAKFLLLAIIFGAVLSSYALQKSSLLKPKVDLQKCTSQDRCLKGCNKMFTIGCVCYNDGTCESGNAQICSACQNPNVYGVISTSDKCPNKVKVGKAKKCRPSNDCTCN
mmetsp:Transcript_12880/g.14789  ORF Transcript_12880/g.14789 Transcript_12880/m.14789 type:complete len:112 (+) Transcript_12880:20-355(+)